MSYLPKNEEVGATHATITHTPTNRHVPTLKWLNVILVLTTLLNQSTTAHSMGTLLHAGPSCIIKPTVRSGQHWSSLQEFSTVKHRGICYSTLLCKQKGGVAIGKCGLGNSCCVFPQSCNSISVRNSTYFTNPDYPAPANRTSDQCSLTIHRMPGIHPICQFRLDFIEYDIEGRVKETELISKASEPNSCNPHSDLITLKAMHTEDHIVPPICATAKVGRHVIVDIHKHIGPFVLTVNTGPWNGKRRWNILINQLECNRNNYQPLWRHNLVSRQ